MLTGKAQVIIPSNFQLGSDVGIVLVHCTVGHFYLVVLVVQTFLFGGGVPLRNIISAFLSLLRANNL